MSGSDQVLEDSRQKGYRVIKCNLGTGLMISKLPSIANILLLVDWLLWMGTKDISRILLLMACTFFSRLTTQIYFYTYPALLKPPVSSILSQQINWFPSLLRKIKVVRRKISHTLSFQSQLSYTLRLSSPFFLCEKSASWLLRWNPLIPSS